MTLDRPGNIAWGFFGVVFMSQLGFVIYTTLRVPALKKQAADDAKPKLHIERLASSGLSIEFVGHTAPVQKHPVKATGMTQLSQGWVAASNAMQGMCGNTELAHALPFSKVGALQTWAMHESAKVLRKKGYTFQFVSRTKGSFGKFPAIKAVYTTSNMVEGFHTVTEYWIAGESGVVSCEVAAQPAGQAEYKAAVESVRYEGQPFLAQKR